jgi:CheY-like chemotaxis protein
VALILAAEDDPDTRGLVARILERAGHEVIPVADGESALRQIRERRPDLVLSDVDMPLVNGFLLCDEVRRDPNLRHIPVILATGVINPDDHRAVEVGAASVLTKPFTGKDLLAHVERQLPPPTGQPYAALDP